MSRFKWDPDVNITKRRPAGMTSKVDPTQEGDDQKPARGTVIKSKQFRKVKKEKSRLAVQGTEKRQGTMLLKHWRYRNFKRCGQCGAYATHESRNPAWTRTTVIKKLSDLFPTPPPMTSLKLAQEGVDANSQTYEVEVEVEFWCYACGAINEKVLEKYEDDDHFAPKARKTTCAECPNEINFARGDKAWRTGEKDPVTGRDDYRCDACETARQAEANLEKEARKRGEKNEYE